MLQPKCVKTTKEKGEGDFFWLRFGSGLVLSLRCLSADDDLGNHSVPPGETWGFHFRTTYPGTTLFHCGFKWALADEKMFHVYNDNVDRYVCTRPGDPISASG
ncbi:hypothetical protein MLD38_035322 [Melastoma candidum]|uniref:Uncharacterized protein n=1 Tax=Melastoma candidum TaxID=119954 RepID=A0ACB9LGU4_9MYRT|nr:hypothetical protein MLD38_035322 [Melastoma candidum]